MRAALVAFSIAAVAAGAAEPPVLDLVARARLDPPVYGSKVTSITAYGEMRVVLATPIPYRRSEHVRLPARPVLTLGLAVQPDILGQDLIPLADPVVFRVSVTDADGAPDVLVDRTVDVRARPEDRRWFDERVDLGALAGRDVTITLSVEVQGNPARHARPYALLASPRIRNRDDTSPGLLLVTVDALRADHVGAWGYSRPTTPALDALAGDGVRFAQAYATAPMTLPSLPQFFTSSLFPLPGQPTLMSAFVAAGIPSAAVVNNVFLALWLAETSREAAFDVTISSGELDAHAITDRALAWLDAHRGDRAVLYLHYLDTHTPYHPPARPVALFRDPGYRGPIGETFGDVGGARTPSRYDERDRAAIVALYDAALRYVDDELAHLLAALRADGRLERTLVVVTADHGEEFWDHGGFFHGQSLHDELLHVPLLVRLPGAAHAGTVVGRSVRAIDVAPAIASWMGLTAPASFTGRSVADAVAYPAGASDDLVATAVKPEFPTRYAIRTPGWKLVETVNTGARALYDLVADPRETRNVIGGRPAVARTLADRLAEARAPLTRRGFQIRIVGPAAGAPARFRLRLDAIRPGTILTTLDRTAGPPDTTIALARRHAALKARGQADGAGRGFRFDVQRGFLEDGAGVEPLRVIASIDRGAGAVVALGATGRAVAGDTIDAADPSVEAAEPPPCTAPPTGVRVCIWRAGGALIAPAPAPEPGTQERLRALGYVN